MNRTGHEDVDFFVGTEVEHSPAQGKKTLFVVGVQSSDDIYRHLSGCEHIYFGANHSFPRLHVNDQEWQQWENMIVTFLKAGYLCTLEVDHACVEGLIEGPLTEFRNFVPMISVKLPYIKLLNYNTTIKIDDRDFDATNPGVWCHSLHDLMSKRKFTSWDDYSKDQPV